MKRLEGKYRGKRIAPQEKKGSGAALPEAGTAGAAGETGGQGRKKTFWSEYGYLIITALVVLLVFRVLLQLAYVPSASMESTIPEPSLLIAWQLPYLAGDPQPERGDIVTFWNEELHKLLKADEVDLNAANALVDEIYTIKANLKKAEMANQLEFNKLLTPEQKAKLKEMPCHHHHGCCKDGKAEGCCKDGKKGCCKDGKAESCCKDGQKAEGCAEKK